MKSTGTYVCTEGVYSILILPETGKVIFSVSKTTMLDNGEELPPEAEGRHFALPAAILADLLTLLETGKQRHHTENT